MSTLMQHPPSAWPHRYKLTYFNGRGLGEGARLLFHQAGVPFEDIRISREQWPEFKSRTPFGQVPVLEVDGYFIGQSAAIYRFLGKQFNLVPKCPFEEALVNSVYDTHKDFHSRVKDFTLVTLGYGEGDREKLLKEAVLPARDKYFAFLEKCLERSGGDYLVGRSLSWADIVISDNLAVLQGQIPDLFDGYPAVKKFVDGIHELPNIKKYVSERPASAF